MANIASLLYPERLQTFKGHWDEHLTTARQLAAIGHICDRPPLEALDEGSRCISCDAFVKKELSVRALEGESKDSLSYENGFKSFNLHTGSCTRLQSRIPLEPQAVLAGLHGGRIHDLRSRFERKAPSNTPQLTGRRALQQSSLFSLPTELRLQIYAMVLPSLENTTEIVQLNPDSARVITTVGYHKTGPRNITKQNILRTCRAVHEEAIDLLYHTKTFKFSSTKIMYLFLRSIGKSGRGLIESIDIHSGSREDAIGYALLASCDNLRSMCLRISKPMTLLRRAPIWMIDSLSCLLSLSGMQQVTFGSCPTHLYEIKDDSTEAEAIKTRLKRPKDIVPDVEIITSFLDDRFSWAAHIQGTSVRSGSCHSVQ